MDAAGLTMKKGRCGIRTQDRQRRGTTTLAAALSTLDGMMMGGSMPRHWHQEVVPFQQRIDGETPSVLDRHLIIDNCRTHKHPSIHPAAAVVSLP